MTGEKVLLAGVGVKKVTEISGCPTSAKLGQFEISKPAETIPVLAPPVVTRISSQPATSPHPALKSIQKNLGSEQDLKNAVNDGV